MRVGEIFQRYGAYWMAECVETEENKTFRWLKVTALWSGFGPMPLWADEARVFLMHRTHKATGVAMNSHPFGLALPRVVEQPV